MGKPDETERRSDTFVVRLWRERASGRVIRAEIEHIQSGLNAERRWRRLDDESDEERKEWIVEHLLPATSQES